MHKYELAILVPAEVARRPVLLFAPVVLFELLFDPEPLFLDLLGTSQLSGALSLTRRRAGRLEASAASLAA